MDVSVAAMILVAGLFSGFVDAVAGGGGLIMIPALMLGGLPAHAAVATNKLCGTAGCLSSSVVFLRARLVDWRACLLVGGPAVLGAVAGSRLISQLPRAWAEPTVIGLVLAVTAWLLFKRKAAGATDAVQTTDVSVARMLQVAACGALVGFHDGFFGPGAGAFMAIALLALWSVNFVRGTASAKVIALMTNVAAMLSFVWIGAVDVPKGLIAAAGVFVGAHAGAAVVTRTGARMLQPVVIVITMVMVGKLLVDYVIR